MENKIIELRNWFRTHGKMDFELNKKLPKEEQGKHITYKCKDIEDAFTRALGDSSHESAALPLHDVSVSLLERAYGLVGHPCTNISAGTDLACEQWRSDYERWRNER